MKTILITGGAGFIGSNFVKYMRQNHPEDRLVNVDALTYAGNLENLESLRDDAGHIFVKADIRDRSAMDAVFAKYQPVWVVNFAAESHVDRSIEDPEVFLSTNVIGTQVLLDTARKYWKSEPDNRYSRAFLPDTRFHQVSTDEVYGALGAEGMFVETMPLQPNSPYSAAKGSADLLVRAYHETFGLPVTISRCSNNYGPYQFPEKLIPLMISNCLRNKPLPVYGDGLQIRDWLHVWDHCAAIDAILHRGRSGEIYNIGGNNERTNLEIVMRIIHSLGRAESLITHVQDRLGHDRRYAIDNTKITTELGWKPTYTFEQGMEETIAWYLENEAWMRSVTSGDYLTYYEKMYAGR